MVIISVNDNGLRVRFDTTNNEFGLNEGDLVYIAIGRISFSGDTHERRLLGYRLDLTTGTWRSPVPT